SESDQPTSVTRISVTTVANPLGLYRQSPAHLLGGSCNKIGLHARHRPVMPPDGIFFARMNFALGQKGRQWRTKRTPQLLRSVSPIRGNASSFTLTPQCLLLTHAGMHALSINLRFVASAGRRQAIPPFGLGRP